MTNHPSQDMGRGLYLINSPSQLVTPRRLWTGLDDLHTARDALEPLPPVVWLVEQIIQPASLSVFFGDPGCKKTFSLIDLGNPCRFRQRLVGDEGQPRKCTLH